MSRAPVSRESFIGVIALVWVVGAIIALVVLWPRDKDPAVISHWANVYMMDDPVFPALSKQFNADKHRTSSGRPIEVQPILVNSGLIGEELASQARDHQPSGFCNSAVGGCIKTPPPN